MSGPINTALRRIRLLIDPILLKAGFRDEMVSFGNHQRNIRDIITEKIIYGQVLPDLAIVAPTEKWVALKREYIVHQKDDNVVVTIPANAIGNRSIIAPLQVAYLENTPLVGRSGFMESDTLRIIDNGPNIVGTVSTELRKMSGENTILMTNFDDQDIDRWAMEVMLGHDGEFSGIPPSYHLKFANLCVLAVKSYLSVHQSSVLDVAESNGGVSISSLRRHLERFEGAADSYDEELAKWKKFSQMYDDNADTDFIQMTTSFL